jgi:hypothetical protein
MQANRGWKHRVGLAVFLVGLSVSLSALMVVPNPQDESGAFDSGLRRFAGCGVVGVALLIVGQSLQKAAGQDVAVRLAQLIDSDRQQRAKPRVAWPDWPSNRTWVDPRLDHRPPKPHSAVRAVRLETSL